MYPISRAPQGLLELLNLKGTGSNPREFSEVLQGVLSLDELYLAPLRASQTTNTPTINANGSWAAAGPVPAGELWLVTNVTYTAPQLGAGETARLVPAIFWGGSLTQPEALGESVLWGALDRPVAGYPLPRAPLCQSGVQFGLQVVGVSAGATVWSLTVHYYRLAF